MGVHSLYDYDIYTYFSKLNLNKIDKISFESEFYQNNVFKSKIYSDDKLKANKEYTLTLRKVLINILSLF